MNKKRLGKGLGALISESRSEGREKKIVEVYIDEIEPNPYQPREEFDRDSLQELGNSIREKGLIQPVTLRQVEPQKYQLVAGERRWRAAKIAGLKSIPAVINDYTDRQMMEIALVENLQREDLNPIEEAQAYRQMIEEFDMTQEKVAEKVGKSRSSVANMVRLLNLPPRVQIYVSRETLSMGHARALLSLDDSQKQVTAARHIIDRELSVRQTEEYISRLKNPPTASEKEEKSELDRKWIQARDRLASRLGKEVQLRNRKNSKVIAITCKEYKDIEEIISRLEKTSSPGSK